MEAPKPVTATDTAFPDGVRMNGEPSGLRYSRVVAAQPFPQIVFILGRTGVVHFHRSLAEESPDNEAAGATIYDYVIPQQEEFVRQALAFVFEHGEAFGFELAGLGPRTLSSWFQCRLAPNLRDGRVVSATLVATDVTIYKQREIELERERDELRQRLAEQAAGPKATRAPTDPGPEPTRGALDLVRLHAVSDRAGEAAFLSDAGSGQLVDANETACRWMGLSKRDLLARSVRDLRGEPPLQVPNPADHPFTETRASARPRVLEGVCRRKDGSTFAVESSIAAVTIGERECILAVVRDAKRRGHTSQQLRDFQERYRSLFADVRDAVFLTTRAGEVVEANGSALTLFGCPGDEIVGLDVSQRLVFLPDDVQRFREDAVRKGRVSDRGSNTRRLITNGFGRSAVFKMVIRCMSI